MSSGWNFCPWCGHRIYQHDKQGCVHVGSSHNLEWVDGSNRRRREPCDCLVGLGALIGVMQ